MISALADFQPLSVANKIKIFSYISNRGFTERYFSDKVHAILIEEVPVQTTLCDGATSVDSQVYYWIAVGEPSHKMRTGLSPTSKNEWNA